MGTQGSWRRDAQSSLAVTSAGLAFWPLVMCIHHITELWDGFKLIIFPPPAMGRDDTLWSGSHLHPHSAPWIYPVGFRLWLCPCSLSRIKFRSFSVLRKSVNFSAELDYAFKYYSERQGIWTPLSSSDVFVLFSLVAVYHVFVLMLSAWNSLPVCCGVPAATAWAGRGEKHGPAAATAGWWGICHFCLLQAYILKYSSAKAVICVY